MLLEKPEMANAPVRWWWTTSWCGVGVRSHGAVRCSSALCRAGMVSDLFPGAVLMHSLLVVELWRTASVWGYDERPPCGVMMDDLLVRYCSVVVCGDLGWCWCTTSWCNASARHPGWVRCCCQSHGVVRFSPVLCWCTNFCCGANEKSSFQCFTSLSSFFPSEIIFSLSVSLVYLTAQNASFTCDFLFLFLFFVLLSLRCHWGLHKQ